MNSKEQLIAALQDEIDNADFSTEETQDDSYQYAIIKITEIFKDCDDTLDLHDVVKTVNILDDLDLVLKDAYEAAIQNLENKGE